MSIALFITTFLFIGVIQSSGQTELLKFAKDSELVNDIMSTAIIDHQALYKRYDLGNRISDPQDIEKWFLKILDLWEEGLIPIPGGSPEQYAFAVHNIEPKAYTDENESTTSTGTTLIILAGHDLGPDIHNSRSYHWAGLYAFNETSQNVGYGWWSVRPERFNQLIENTTRG